MKRFSLFILFFACSFSAFSQKGFIVYVSELIQQNKYAEADHYLDSLLKIDSRNIDALMMKGNVILNREFVNLPDVVLIDSNAESVFDTIGPVPQTGVKIIPEQTVHEVEKYWKRALVIDKSRADIYKGFCTVYAMALMKKDLEKEILLLIKNEKDEDGGQAFRIAEYARKFKERGRLDDAIDIYKFIAQQFPALPGIICDMGSELFYAGRIEESQIYLDSALRMKKIDESTYLNSAFIYSQLGYFDKAYGAFNGYSQNFHTRMNIFYKGLLLFANSDKDYYSLLNNFVSVTDSNAYYPEYLLAKDLMAYRDSFTIDDFRQVLGKDHPEWYKPLIYQRAMNDFEQNCEPFIYYGIFQAFLKNYTAAVQLLSDGEKCKMTPPQTEEWELYYAYSLYRSKDGAKAATLFEPLLKAESNFKRQAATYFIAKVNISAGKQEEGKKLLNELTTAKEQTKYGPLAKLLLAQISSKN